MSRPCKLFAPVPISPLDWEPSKKAIILGIVLQQTPIHFPTWLTSSFITEWPKQNCRFYSEAVEEGKWPDCSDFSKLGFLLILFPISDWFLSTIIVLLSETFPWYESHLLSVDWLFARWWSQKRPVISLTDFLGRATFSNTSILSRYWPFWVITSTFKHKCICICNNTWFD